MNDVIQNTLNGPLGWQIIWAVLAGVGIIVVVAILDGPILRTSHRRRERRIQGKNSPPREPQNVSGPPLRAEPPEQDAPPPPKN